MHNYYEMLRYNPHMKHLYRLISPPFLLLLLTSCGSSSSVAPSQNDALNKISNSKGKEKSSYMQQGLDSWLEEEWNPTVEQDVEIQDKYMHKVEGTKSQVNAKEIGTPEKERYVEKKNRAFTLQEYADKANAYNKREKKELEESHTEKLKEMPVIGK